MNFRLFSIDAVFSFIKQVSSHNKIFNCCILIVFPNCKINLGLYILDKRPDGFHNLQTIFFPIPLKDSLEIIPAHNTPEAISFSASGIEVDGAAQYNLCIKAYNLVKENFPLLPHIQMHLHKAIPMGAGLGGGSADAAFTLSLLNKKFQLELSAEQLIQYALQLGSDCPFFIINKPCTAAGRGEILEEVTINLAAYKIILINPGIHVNTGWAFTQLNRQTAGENTPAFLNRKALSAIIQQPISTWKNELVNDFEKPVFEKYPAVQSIKEALYKQGAIYAAMSGSGSTVYGLFDKAAKPVLSMPAGYFMATMPL